MTPPLAELIAGQSLLAAWPWVPSLGLGLALRVDGVAAGVAIAVAAGALAVARSARRESPDARTGRPFGRWLLLAVALLGAAVADDLALLWCCLEVAALAQAALLHADGGGVRRLAPMLAAFTAAEAGGLALLAAALLVADVTGGFRLGDAWRSSALLRAHALWLPMAGLVLAAAGSRLVPCFVPGEARGAWLARGAGVAAAVLLALRLGPALGTTRATMAVLAALGASAVTLAAWRASRRERGAGGGPAAPQAPSLLAATALAARLLWRPFAAPSLTLSLTALAAGTALAVALGAGAAKPGTWPGPTSPAWTTLAGSGWLLLAALAAVSRPRSARAARTLGWAAAGSLLLLVASVPAVVAGAEIAAGLPALWLLVRNLALPRPSRRALLALGTTLAAVALARQLHAGAGLAPLGGTADGLAGFVPLAPLALPLVAGALLFGLRRAAAGVRRGLAGLALLANLALAAGLLAVADHGTPLGLALGIGPAPFGLHLLLDRLAAELLLVAALLGGLAFLHGLARPDAARGAHAEAIVQLELCGVAGTVLAADLAELVLFFGITLLAAHAASSRSDRGPPSAAAARAAVVWAAGTALMLVAVGAIYAAVGTLGYAELASRVPQVAAGDAPLLHIAAYLLLIALALRAAAVPFGWWLAPALEARPATAVAGPILIVLTGIYALLRLYVLVFPCFGVGPCGPSGLVLPLGLATLAAGGIAALAATGPAELAAPLLFGAIGALLVGVGTFRAAGFAAAIYALAPAALGGAALAFAAEGRRHGAIRVAALWAALGLPPFPGWIGRIALLGATGADALAVWTLLLSAALLATVASARVVATAGAPPPSRPAGEPVAAISALALLVAFTLASGPAFELATRTARQVLDRQATAAASPAAATAAR